MFWITLETENEIHWLDATDFVTGLKAGKYRIHLADGTEMEGEMKDVKYLHVQEPKTK